MPSTQAIPEKRAALVIVAALMLMFAIVSWVAASGKSSTYDEPVHALGSWMVLHRGDFRIDPENPPLWQHWAGLANGADDLQVDVNDPMFGAVLHRDQDLRYQTTVRWLYQTPPNDGEGFVRHSRLMMLLVALAACAGVAAWCWRIAGATAGVAGATLFALDPNLLGHAPLVKNDVALAGAILWLASAIWLLGHRPSPLRIINLALALAAAMTIKLTALIAPAIVALLLLIRTMSREPCGKLERRSSKLMSAIGALLVCAIVCYVAIWACYHFRFDPTPEAHTALERQTVYRAALSRGVTPGIVYHLAEFAEQQRLLPQAFLHGVMYQILMAHGRKMFLCGQYSYTGWWYYFPLAALFKTPLTTLLVLIGTFGWSCARLLRNRPSPQLLWTMLCLLLPASILLISAMASGVNVGLRHIFPVYILAYVAAGVIVGKIWNRHGKRIRWAIVVLGVALAVESLSAFPNYIAYFNFPSVGSRAGLKLLSDSNLDWGQDLPLLADWQHEHPATPMYVLYFGSVDPRAYGITLTPPAANQDAVLAISATSLQGIYADPVTLRRIAYVRKHQPFAILGGTIYLYTWTPADNLAMQQQEQTP